MAVILTLAVAASACATPYEAEPTSIYQWQRQQDAILRQACAAMDKDSPRYARDCAGVSR